MPSTRSQVSESTHARTHDVAARLAGAACAGHDGEVFFAGEDLLGARLTLAAKAVCSDCVVVKACLAWALENNEMFGVWGGLTRPERERVRVRARTALKAS